MEKIEFWVIYAHFEYPMCTKKGDLRTFCAHFVHKYTFRYLLRNSEDGQGQTKNKDFIQFDLSNWKMNSMWFAIRFAIVFGICFEGWLFVSIIAKNSKYNDMFDHIDHLHFDIFMLVLISRSIWYWFCYTFLFVFWEGQKSIKWSNVSAIRSWFDH